MGFDVDVDVVLMQVLDVVAERGTDGRWLIGRQLVHFDHHGPVSPFFTALPAS